jgi:hypothetical protein
MMGSAISPFSRLSYLSPSRSAEKLACPIVSFWIKEAMGQMSIYAFGFKKKYETPAITSPTTKMIAEGVMLLLPRKPVAADAAASGVQMLLIRLSRPIAAIRTPIATPQSFGEPQPAFLSLVMTYLLI